MGTKYKGSTIEINALNAFIALVRCVTTLSMKLEQHIAKYNLTSGQFGILEALFHLGTMSQRDLGKKLLSSKGNITLIVDNLEKRELVERLSDLEDRRITNIQLSKKGKASIKKIMPSMWNLSLISYLY